MNRVPAVLLVTVACGWITMTARAADWRDWFGSRPAVAAQSPDDDDIPSAHSGFDFNAPDAGAGEPAKPNMLARMGQGTRSFFGRTRQAFTPKSKPEVESVPKDRPFQGWSPNGSRKSSKAKAAPRSSWWFSKKPPQGPSETMEAFLSQPRP